MTAKRASSAAKSKSEAERHPVDDRRVDEALEETFPASDPPFFVGAGADVDNLSRLSEADAETAAQGRRPTRQEKHQDKH